MKQFVKTNLAIQLDGITPYISNLAQIDVVFSQRKTYNATETDTVQFTYQNGAWVGEIV